VSGELEGGSAFVVHVDVGNLGGVRSHKWWKFDFGAGGVHLKVGEHFIA